MVVTISNEYGCGALAVAMAVARELGYEYVDQQLPAVVSKRLRITPESVDAGEEGGRTLGQRLLASLERATPELAQSSATQPPDEELVGAIAAAVREYAGRGNVVIVGRGASAILGAREDVLRVFMHARRDWRIATIMETTGARRDVAEAEVERVDRARSAYIRQWYGRTFGDVREYDLCIDTSRMAAVQCVALIVA
ncbi:MAG: cytidylate kinase-like family protein, partial [Candidatus Eremiobacteraeota bacterium]|nr:cytidylate kinase-like family protein [Candidatus Eremiobacteraeota bacterium]